MNRTAGTISIILGIIFIIFPMFSQSLVSLIVGLSLLFFGISSVFMGWNMRSYYDVFSTAFIIIGIIAIIFGFIFAFYIDALPFLMGLSSYIVGFIMIVFGIAGLISKSETISSFSAILVLIMGIIAIALAITAMTQPLYIAIIIGIVLIIEGVNLYLSD